MKLARLGIVITALFTQSCKLGGVILPSAGTYHGHYNAQDVTATVERKDYNKLLVSLKTQEPQATLFTIKMHLNGNIDIQSNSKLFPHLEFKPNSSSCFESIKTWFDKISSIEFCWEGDEIHASGTLKKVPQFKLDLALSKSSEIPDLEPPSQYKVSELIERAKKRNFESVNEFKKLLETKAQAEVAYLTLYPHANLNDGLGVLSLSYLFVLRSIGDLAPFLLPSRWFRAKEAKDLLDAEKESWLIMDLDGMNITESLAYAARRDSESFSRLQKERDAIEGLRDLVKIKESNGLLQLGSSDDLTSLLNQIENTQVDLENTQKKELSALGHAAGFYNPQAILGVEPDEPTNPHLTNYSVQNPISFDLDQAKRDAVIRSSELLQVKAMIQWANDNRSERIFNWLDPIADSSSGLGISFPSYMEVSYHQIDEMKARKNLLESIIFQKVSDTLNDMNTSIKDYHLAKESQEIQARRVLRISQNLKMGITFVMSDLIAALQDQVKADMNVINSEYGYLISLSKMNRLLYKGHYDRSNILDDNQPGSEDLDQKKES